MSDFLYINKTNLSEMKDWKQHFTNGTKGMPKTDSVILNYVESILKKSYEGNEDKVNNNPIAPWLVKVVADIGPININTEKINRIKAVIDYVKKTGNVANIPKMDLIQGSDFAKEKLDKMAEKEKHNSQDNKPQEKEPEKPVKKELSPEELALKYQKKSKELFPELSDETNGNIERVWTCTDGSGRMWVKVLNTSWLNRHCETGDLWGIVCQGGSFGNSRYVNYQLIGPPKGKSSPIKTIIGMGVLKDKGSIAEVKQEGNVQPGSQKTSGGWTDADEMLIEFLTFAPEAKWITYFGDYHGRIVLNASDALHGGGIGFLYHLADEKPDLFKKLAEKRPDMIEANSEIINQIFPNAEELLNFDINKFAQEKPEAFLLNIKKYIQKYGKEAKDILNSFDLISISKQSPQLIENILDDLISNIPNNKFQELVNGLDLSNYVWNNRLKAYSLIEKLSVINDRTTIKNIVTKYSSMFIDGSGGGVKGAITFLREMGKPKLENHKNAKKDLADGKYYSEREENVKDENGKDVRDANGNILKKIVKFEIPDNLLILTQKERRDFINANKDFIKNSIKADEKGKEITFLRLLFSQSNSQEIEKNMKKEKDDFVAYYDSKFKLGEKKKVKLEDKDEIIESPYMPGEFELYSILNPKGVITDDNKVYYPIGVDSAKKNIVNIIKYYYDNNLSKEKEEIKRYYGKRLTPDIAKEELTQRGSKLKYSAIKDYILTLIYSGEKEENALEYFLENFNPEKLNLSKTSGYQLMFGEIKKMVSDELFYSTLKKYKTKLLELGEQGKGIYEQYISLLDVSVFQVKPGDMVMYKSDEYLEEYEMHWDMNLNADVINKGPIFLTQGRKYSVFDVGEYAGSQNGKILILDEGYTSVRGEKITPTKRWFNSRLFEINKSTINSQSMNEKIFRSFVQKRLKMLSENKKAISYTGIMLDNKSKKKLYDWIKDMIKAKKLPPIDGWEFSADHVTINTGKSQDTNLLEKNVELKVLQYAFDEKIAAVSIVPIVDGVEIEFTKEKPHITIAYDKANGARPVQSNELINWKPVPKSFILNGIIKEVPL